jgi:hypothetical protein
MNQSISLDEFPGPLRDRLKQVIDETQTAVLVEDSRPVAEIRPLQKATTVAEFADVLAAAPRLSAAEAESFARDVEEARARLNERPIRDPWQS